MSNESAKTQRPLLITVICVLGFLAALALIWIILYPSLLLTLQHFGIGYTYYLTFSVMVLLICMIGLWLMKRWAVYAYAAVVVINQIALLMFGRWNIWSILLPVIVIFFGYKNLSKMS